MADDGDADDVATDGALRVLHERLPDVDARTAASVATALAELQSMYAKAAVARAQEEVAAPARPQTPEEAADEAVESPVELEAGIDAADDAAALKKREANRKKRAAQKAKRAEQHEQHGDAPAAAVADDASFGFPKEVTACVRVFSGERGRGLQCTRRVRKGEVLIGIPKAWALTTDQKGVGDSGSSGQVSLARQLVSLKRAGDFRVSYLPTSIDMPAFWTADELAMLRLSYVLEPASSQRATLEGMYAKEGLADEDCTLDEFIWAMCMVQSRTFAGAASNTILMLPFIDLLNCESTADLAFDLRDDGPSGYINVHASRDFEEGEEALVNYHGTTPPELYSTFLAYGFVPTSGVRYPGPLELFSCDDPQNPDDLKALLECWTRFYAKLADAPALADDNEHATGRAATARLVLRNEREMATQAAVALRKRLLAIQKSKKAQR